MSRDIIRFCGTTLQRFSKNDPVLTRVPGAYPLYNCQRKVLENNELHSKTRKNAINWAKEWDWSKRAIEILNQLLEIKSVISG